MTPISVKAYRALCKIADGSDGIYPSEDAGSFYSNYEPIVKDGEKGPHDDMPGFQYGLKRAGGATMAGLGNTGMDLVQASYAPARIENWVNKAFWKPVKWASQGLTYPFTGRLDNSFSRYIDNHLASLDARDRAFDNWVAQSRQDINDYWVPYDPNTTMNLNEDLKATHATARTAGHVMVGAATAGVGGKTTQTAMNGINKLRWPVQDRWLDRGLATVAKHAPKTAKTVGSLWQAGRRYGSAIRAAGAAADSYGDVTGNAWAKITGKGLYGINSAMNPSWWFNSWVDPVNEI